MELKLKKLYQTFDKSFPAGTVKTVGEWKVEFPNLVIGFNNTFAANTDWFEVVRQPYFSTHATLKGDLVPKSTVVSRTFEYDGKKIDCLDISARLESQEDIKNVIEYLQVHRYCFASPIL